MEQLTLKSLAERLNLSVSTVSKALRDSHEISAETKEKIVALARELNYFPNPHASSLRRQKSKVVAVLLPEVANNFFAQVINGIETVTQEKGYHVLIYLSHEDYSKEVEITRHLQNGRVDGIIMSLSSSTADTKHLEELQEKDIPVVFFDRICETISTTKITTNDFESGYNATKHLIEQGCKRIACLHISRNLSISSKRLQGYLKALEDHHIEIEEDLIINCSNSEQENIRLMSEVMRKEEGLRPDGVFSTVEHLAIAFYRTCEIMQINIPQDVKIISFSNLEVASLFSPSLTTIHQPAFDMGKEAATILFKALHRNSSTIYNETIVLESTLIKRNSTGN